MLIFFLGQSLNDSNGPATPSGGRKSRCIQFETIQLCKSPKFVQSVWSTMASTKVIRKFKEMSFLSIKIFFFFFKLVIPLIS